MLTRDQILAAAASFPLETVNVPAWGGDVAVRAMNGAEREEYETQLVKYKDKAWIRLVVFCVVDESGNRIFTGDDDVELLAKSNSIPLLAVADAARRINGLEAQAASKAEKNYGPSRAGCSSSGWRSRWA